MKQYSSTIRLLLILIAGYILHSTNPTAEDFVSHRKTKYVESSRNGLEYAFTSLTKGFVGLDARTYERQDMYLFSIYEDGRKKYLGIFGQFVEL